MQGGHPVVVWFGKETAPLPGIPAQEPSPRARLVALPHPGLPCYSVHAAARGDYNRLMANLTLVYGLRLLPSDEVVEVGEATLKLKNGREARVTMHLLEGSKEEIEKQLTTSLEAFFDFYPEI